ncbi:MAG: hypothetical protein V3R21_03745 [Woeseiaceae bacterium]
MRLITACMICALLTACGGPSAGPEEALRQWVADAENAAEDLDRRSLIAMISENYADARGNDRDAIDKLLRFYFLRQKAVVLVMKIDEMTITDGTAAEILLTVAGIGTTSRALGVNADAYQFSLELEMDEDEWMLIGARWGEVGQKLH